MVLLILVFFSGLFTIHARRDQMGGYNNACVYIHHLPFTQSRIF